MRRRVFRLPSRRRRYLPPCFSTTERRRHAHDTGGERPLVQRHGVVWGNAGALSSEGRSRITGGRTCRHAASGKGARARPAHGCLALQFADAGQNRGTLARHEQARARFQAGRRQLSSRRGLCVVGASEAERRLCAGAHPGRPASSTRRSGQPLAALPRRPMPSLPPTAS